MPVRIDMHKLSMIRAPLPQSPPTPCSVSDPYESSEYAAFVETMADKCHCDPELRPCDGCLAGGLCDDIHREDDDEPNMILTNSGANMGNKHGCV